MIIGQITSQLGAFKSVKGEGNPYTVLFEKGSAVTYAVLDRQGRMAGLQFTELIPLTSSLEEALERVSAIEGSVSYLIRKNGKTLAAQNEQEPMAVGSAFKLAVLAAVDEAVKDGSLDWDQTVELDPAWKSLPTGVLQDWSEGISLTIETLAALMISISDNTAADALISIAGRKEIERFAPDSVPFLTTGEAFRLKNPENQDLAKKYLKSSAVERSRILEDISDRELPNADLFTSDPILPDIEWFMSTAQLADLIEQLQHLEVMTINPGLAKKSAWKRVAYKGGSEPGIMNLTTYLAANDSSIYTVSLTVNHPEKALDEAQIYTAYQGILQALQ